MPDHPPVGDAPARLDEFCLSLPEATLVRVEGWGGEPTYRVNNKVFVFASPRSCTVKLPRDEAAAVTASDPRCTVSPYIGRHGWISVALADADEATWDQVEEWVTTSYKLIAPKRLAAQLG